MNKFFLSFITLIITVSTSFAQRDIEELEKDSFSNKNHFIFNKFIEGNVYFKNGSALIKELNYSVYSNEIYFYDNDELLTISNLNKIRNVKIKGLIFIPYNKKFYELLYVKNYKLLKLRTVDFGNKTENTAIYGSGNQTSSVKQVKNINDHSLHYSIEDKGKVDLEKELKVFNKFYILKDNRLSPLTKKKVLRIHKDKKKEIESFIKENNIRLTNEVDLIKLVEYCNL